MARELWNECYEYAWRLHALRSARLVDGKVVGDAAESELAPADGLKWLYELLTVLDQKASALMTLNGILVAASMVFVTQAPSPQAVLQISLADVRVMLASAFLSSLSIGVCLWIVMVRWKFMGRVECVSMNMFDFTPELRSLQREGALRQRLYQCAWFLSLVAVVLFLVGFGILGGRTI